MAQSKEVGFLRRFPFMWGLLTLVYGIAVAYRGIINHVTPGLPTFAGFTAVAAVWLDFYGFIRRRILLRVGVILCLLGTIALNGAIIADRAAAVHRIPPGRTFFTLIFIVLLVDKTRDVLAQLHHA